MLCWLLASVRRARRHVEGKESSPMRNLVASCTLEHPGLTLATRELIQGRLPRGNYTTLALSFDQRTIYFAFAERASAKPDFYSRQRRSFHLFAMDVDGGHLRQLTRGLEDDFDPCPLPDGGLAFISSRRGGFGRCHNPWEPLPTYTLHRLDAEGQEVVTLSFHETNEWHPCVMNDGRIARSLDPQLGGDGEFVLVDVRRSLMPLPASRPIRQLRIFQVLPKTTNHVANQPRIGYANAESARLFLGTVPVENDGSAYFRAPAGKPLYFQAVDEQGRAVHTMRSITYLQAGERRSFHQGLQ